MYNYIFRALLLLLLLVLHGSIPYCTSIQILLYVLCHPGIVFSFNFFFLFVVSTNEVNTRRIDITHFLNKLLYNVSQYNVCNYNIPTLRLILSIDICSKLSQASPKGSDILLCPNIFITFASTHQYFYGY